MKEFFGIQPSDKRQEAPQNQQLARKIIQSLKSHHMLTGNSNPQKTAPLLNPILKKFGFARVEQVLNWYISVIDREDTFTVNSVKAFCNAFGIIAKKHDRHAPIKLSSDAKAILAKLDDYGWAYGSSADLPRFVQKSLDNYAAFRRKVIAFCDRQADTKDYRLELAREAWEQILDEYMPCESFAFVLIWCDFVHTKLHQWEKWDGNLEPWIWSIHHRQALRALESEFYERGTLRHHFEQYLSLVTEGK